MILITITQKIFHYDHKFSWKDNSFYKLSCCKFLSAPENPMFTFHLHALIYQCYCLRMNFADTLGGLTIPTNL
ncbi:hypothetical protein EB796_007131 [Bugula neritina]|uniref:Uncharacterized protein n=1 Tax=Bugula neritina TaxID=10212 RepID=A0A7J7K9D1_BUGNE|nr:hypothetical protein EB796_007131 [Bugula neritina]